MYQIYIMIPLIVVLATVIYGIVRALGRIWLDHRIRLALLDKLLEKPELIESYSEVQHVIVNAFDGASKRPRQDYALTGIILTAIGVASALVGRSGDDGRISVGLFVGGWICIALGLLLAVIGIFIHRLERNLMTIPKKDRPPKTEQNP